MVAGTITEAAKLLRTSQPSVSRLITDLESTLELALFERRHGRVSATPEALHLFEEVERSFVSLDRLAQFAREIRDFRSAQISIAGMPALCLDLLPFTLASFLEHHSGARIALHARSSQQVVGMVMSQQCEVGLASPPFDVRGVAGEMLVSAPCVCALPADHPLCDRDVLTPRDLANEHLILLTSSITRGALEAVFQAEGVPMMQPRLETPLSIVSCRLAELGLGIAIIDPFTAAYLPGNTVIKPLRPIVPFLFGVLTPESQIRARAVQRLIDILRDALERHTLPGGETPAILPFSAQH